MEDNKSGIYNITSNNKSKETECHKRDLGIYIHIPFCARKCNYCDFLSAPATSDIMNEYVDALLTEIKACYGKTSDYTVPTIFFGGGTPSILDGELIIRIMEELIKIFNVDFDRLEATIEVNPGTVSRRKLADYRKAGINRISFGLQSVNNNELKILGRIHSYEEFLRNYHAARDVGFTNVNIDLMSALPRQTLMSWEETLLKTVALQPEHISAYSLIIEEGTPFYDLYNENGKYASELPDEETERSIYHLTREVLRSHGYYRYEISNYAKPGYESRHNSSYWTGTDYLGFGLGASSLLCGVRFDNLNDLKSYIGKCNEYKARSLSLKNSSKEQTYEHPLLEDEIGLRENIIKLSTQQKMEEFMFLGLRLMSGISKNDFKTRFNQDIDSVYGDIIYKHKRNGLLEVSGDRIFLTEYGIDISNYVLSDFILT